MAPKWLIRQGARWEPPADGWVLDLAVRPPTPALDLLTDYLEVKYRWGQAVGGSALHARSCTVSFDVHRMACVV